MHVRQMMLQTWYVGLFRAMLFGLNEHTIFNKYRHNLSTVLF